MTPARMPGSNERGTILVPVILVTLILGGLSVALLTEGLAERQSVAQRRADLVALEICEAGLIKASLEVLSQTDGGTDGIGTVSGSYANGTYAVTAVQDATQTDRWTVTARGSHQLANRRVEVGLRRRTHSDFVEGLFAKDTMTFNGTNRTDSYDSRLGTYASQAVNSDAGGAFAGTKGHVGSNGDIVLHGSSVMIRGNAIPGPLHETRMSGNPVVAGDTLPRRREIELEPASLAEFQAAMTTNNNAELLPPPRPAPGGSGGNGNDGSPPGKGGGGSGSSTPPGNSGGGNSGGGNSGGGNSGGGNSGGGGNTAYDASSMSLRANGSETITLTGGTYFFSDVTLTGQATLEVTGPTVIYVTGDFDVSGGGFVNTSGIAGNLIVYAHPYPLPAGNAPGSSQVKIRGGSSAAMAVYAPGADISVAGNDDVYGAFIGDTVTISGNSKFHYDVALGDIGSHSKATIERLYWRDLDERLR